MCTPNRVTLNHHINAYPPYQAVCRHFPLSLQLLLATPTLALDCLTSIQKTRIVIQHRAKTMLGRAVWRQYRLPIVHQTPSSLSRLAAVKPAGPSLPSQTWLCQRFASTNSNGGGLGPWLKRSVDNTPQYKRFRQQGQCRLNRVYTIYLLFLC